MAKTFNIKLGSTDIDGYIKVGGLTIEPNKLWHGADRNLAGDLKATFIGIFPKLLIQFRAMSESELKIILALLSPAVISVQYWDVESSTSKTANYYAGDYGYPFFNDDLDLYNEWNVNLIPYKKR